MTIAVRAAVAFALATLVSGLAPVQGADISSGSGVVIGAKGEVLTNAHVVEGCQKITVKDASGNPETPVLVARDERNDLAVIRLAWPASSVAVFRQGAPFAPAMRLLLSAIPFQGFLPQPPMS
jgi:S1-C subfamily serine protease